MHFAVIDTETNYYDKVMSIGLVIANETFEPVHKSYFIIDPEYRVGGVFYNMLTVIEDSEVSKHRDIRKNVLEYIRNILFRYNVHQIFAYNARFDKSHLSELKDYKWVDIMKIAAYKQYNGFIPDSVECYPKSGRIKRGFGVEPVYRMVTGRTDYNEKHNGYHDAIDELVIMQKLNLPLDTYRNAII